MSVHFRFTQTHLNQGTVETEIKLKENTARKFHSHAFYTFEIVPEIYCIVIKFLIAFELYMFYNIFAFRHDLHKTNHSVYDQR